ncbi:MAG: MOSC domain-containing protein [Bryobacteraceae bacterium]|nr:MOSC domain-containing protein [Bryobacteraceae bacterium]
MRGTVLQINRSKGGIPKTPVEKALVSHRGVDGDDWAHPKFHGGPKQALLLITTESLAELKLLGYDLFPGALGENLTITGMDRREWRAGQRFRAGEVLLELTKLRQPCATLNPYGQGIQGHLYDALCKQGDPSSPVWARGGFYASIVQTGTIHPGDKIELED